MIVVIVPTDYNIIYYNILLYSGLLIIGFYLWKLGLERQVFYNEFFIRQES